MKQKKSQMAILHPSLKDSIRLSSRLKKDSCALFAVTGVMWRENCYGPGAVSSAIPTLRMK